MGRLTVYMGLTYPLSKQEKEAKKRMRVWGKYRDLAIPAT